MPIAPRAGPATLGSRCPIRYASTRLNAVCSPIPSAIGVPKRATSTASEPVTRRAAARSLGVLPSLMPVVDGARSCEVECVTLTLEARIRELPALSHERRAVDEGGGHRVVVAA